jgi:ferredoxin like protein
MGERLAMDHFCVDAEPHLRIIDPSVCMAVCADQVCLYICPGAVYRLEAGCIRVLYESCLECGSCRIACTHLNIEWRFPRGGYGISHQFG